jgi:hypothetical protein
MTKRLLAACAAFVFAASFALAAPAGKAEPLNGTIAAITGTKVEVTIEGAKPDWVKKGAGVKFEGGVGKVLEVTATAITINTKKASTLKVGDKLSLEKGQVVPAGC